ncbi:enoyl-CoA hydratase/isomerase family protein [Rhodococcus sp. NPDC059968]|uniref:enoyl-CoA hydratase/isomerase family protein n=1 Tax=Rhodococcus sp. NPDC059968 TaxID=3347017 RepID=UPI003671A688
MYNYDLPDSVKVVEDGPIRTVLLNRPDQLNATNDEMLVALERIWAQLAADPGARVVVLTGEGRGFSAGGDLEGQLALEDMTRGEVDEWAWRQLEVARRTVLEMLAFPLPVIAAVNGPAVGVGMSLALGCDIILASDRAYFSDPHIAIGLVPGDGAGALMPLHTSLLRAKEFLFTGDRIAATQAVEIGIANKVVAHERLRAEATDLAVRIARLSKTALQGTKRTLNAYAINAMGASLDVGVMSERATIGSPEHLDSVRSTLHRIRRQETAHKP